MKTLPKKRRSRKQQIMDKIEEDGKKIGAMNCAKWAYNLSLADLYMELAYYSGLSAAVKGLGLYERFYKQNPVTAQLFEYYMGNKQSFPSWRAKDIFEDSRFPHVDLAERFEHTCASSLVALGDVLIKTKDIVIEMCVDLLKLILEDKMKADAFIDSCDSKIVHMCSNIKNELLEYEKAYLYSFNYAKRYDIGSLNKNSSMEAVEIFLDNIDVESRELPYVKEYSLAESLAIYSKVQQLTQQGHHDKAQALALEFPLATSTLKSMRRDMGLEELINSEQNLYNAVNDYGLQWLRD